MFILTNFSDWSKKNLLWKGKKKSPVGYKQTSIIKGDNFKGTFNVSNSALPKSTHHPLRRCRPVYTRKINNQRVSVPSYSVLTRLFCVKPGKI